MRYEVLINMGIVGPNAQYKILDERNAHLERLVAIADELVIELRARVIE